MISFESYPPSKFWMRYVSFVNLRKIIKLVGEFPSGLTAKEMTEEIRKSETIFLKEKKKTPSATTIYHYRNTLIHLGIFTRAKGHIQVNNSDSRIKGLLKSSIEENELNEEEKTIFCELVFNQKDCRDVFMDLFLYKNPISKYSQNDWVTSAHPVVWKDSNRSEQRTIQFSLFEKTPIVQLTTENQINSILYGMRYWFRDDLNLIDEIFKENIGSIMFPVAKPDSVTEKDIQDKFISILQFSNEWARDSLRDLAIKICIDLRISLDRFHRFIKNLQSRYPGHIVFIPTSRSFAVITASSDKRENYELRNYLQNEQGVYISHIKVHQKLKEALT